MSTIVVPDTFKRSATRMCDACGDAPPAYLEDGFGGVSVCDTCARYRGGMYNGEAAAAIELIEYAIVRAKGSPGLTGEAIQEAVRLIIEAPEEELGCAPSPGEAVLGSDFIRDRPWERTFRPLIETGVQA